MPPRLSTEKTLIPRLVLHDAVADRLRQYVVEGLLVPGERLNERVLCEQMGVSRTPMREAIKKLAGEGLVRLEPNRGAVVHRLTLEEVAAAFEVVASMEALAGELAAKRASPEQIRHIEALQQKMESAHRAKDLPLYYQSNAEIHAAINEAAGNPVLTEMYRSINLRLQSLRFRSNLDQNKWDAAIKEHQAIAKAMASRDAAVLSELLRQHLINKRDIVLKLLEQET
jgi:DNA-binding GntR family transcriptional regulator